MSRFVLLCLTGLFVASIAPAQPTVQEFPAELSAPFGSIDGRVIVAGDRLVFIDRAQPGGSFYVDRGNIQDFSRDAESVTAQLSTAIRDRSGQRTRVTFRMPDDSARAAMIDWLGRAAGSAAGARSRAGSSSIANAVGPLTYSARHQKRFGGSQGRLVIRDDRIAYEAIDDAQDSREWSLSEIKELKLSSPYKLEVRPFRGDRYTFALDGQGISKDDYNQLVDRIARARSDR